jgi:hypothetical protein
LTTPIDSIKRSMNAMDECKDECKRALSRHRYQSEHKIEIPAQFRKSISYSDKLCVRRKEKIPQRNQRKYPSRVVNSFEFWYPICFGHIRCYTLILSEEINDVTFPSVAVRPSPPSPLPPSLFHSAGILTPVKIANAVLYANAILMRAAGNGGSRMESKDGKGRNSRRNFISRLAKLRDPREI